MRTIMIFAIAIALYLLYLFFNSRTIQIHITKKTQKNQKKESDLFGEIVCKNVNKKLKHDDMEYYTSAYSAIEQNMKHRAKSGRDMNKEFGYEIAHMKTQTDCANDSLTIIGFSLVAVSFIQNLYSLFDSAEYSLNETPLIGINALAFILCIIITVLHPAGKEDDEKRIVCAEILERLEKSEEFFTTYKDPSSSTSDTSNTDHDLT